MVEVRADDNYRRRVADRVASWSEARETMAKRRATAAANEGVSGALSAAYLFATLNRRAIGTACLASQAVAQEQVNVLPQIVVGSDAPKSMADGRISASSNGSRAPASPDRCVEVEIGSRRSMDCLSQKLRREVDRVNPSINLPPIDARSPDAKLGIVNIPGVKQQYGRNFGVSVAPYRPAPPAFSSRIGHR